MTDYTIATFNLKNDMPLTRKFLRWTTRQSALLECIKEMDADVLGVQEATDEMIDELDHVINSYNRVGTPRNKDYKRSSERTDIFYKKDKFICTVHETFWLSSTPNKPGSKTLLSPFPRICTYARLQDVETGVVLHVFNTHLCHLLPYTRTKTMKILLNQIGRYNVFENIILLGDLNTNSDSSTVQHILNNKTTPLKSVYKNEHKINTMHFGKGKIKQNSLPIDYIFVSDDFIINNTKIMIESYDGKYPSDHFPVVTTLTYKEKKK